MHTLDGQDRGDCGNQYNRQERGEQEGELVRAAHVTWAAFLVVGQSDASKTALAYRAAVLLERADDDSVADFEDEVLGMAGSFDMGR